MKPQSTTPIAELDAMPMNCAFCGELIEDDPVRRGSHYFCTPECYQDYLDREAEEEEEEEEENWERDNV